MRWAPEMAATPLHRDSSGDAPGRTLSSRLAGSADDMWSTNESVAWVLISLTGLGAGFYVAVVIAGTSSYACPFQTPVSMGLRSQWKKVRRGTVSVVHSKRVFGRVCQVWDRRVRPLFHRESPPGIPLEDVEVQRSEPQSTPRSESWWLKPRDLEITRQTNIDDTRCVSWILRNITNPEAHDTAVRLAGEIPDSEWRRVCA